MLTLSPCETGSFDYKMDEGARISHCKLRQILSFLGEDVVCFPKMIIVENSEAFLQSFSQCGVARRMHTSSWDK